MKYVIINYTFPILFSEAHAHSDFMGIGNITSAGMVTIYNDRTVHCYGKSISLKLEPDENDKRLIEYLLKVN